MSGKICFFDHQQHICDRLYCIPDPKLGFIQGVYFETYKAAQDCCLQASIDINSIETVRIHDGEPPIIEVLSPNTKEIKRYQVSEFHLMLYDKRSNKNEPFLCAINALDTNCYKAFKNMGVDIIGGSNLIQTIFILKNSNGLDSYAYTSDLVAYLNEKSQTPTSLQERAALQVERINYYASMFGIGNVIAIAGNYSIPTEYTFYCVGADGKYKKMNIAIERYLEHETGNYKERAYKVGPSDSPLLSDVDSETTELLETAYQTFLGKIRCNKMENYNGEYVVSKITLSSPRKK